MTELRFHDRMEGFVSFAERDYNQAWLEGRRARRRCAFDVEIVIADLDAFLDSRGLEAGATGRIECPQLGGAWSVDDGRFNLFEPEGQRRQRMRYRLFGRDAAGRELTLSGFKDISDGPGFDVWPDTTTLFVRLFSGRVAHKEEFDDPVACAARTVATGILHISALGFLRLLLSMRATPVSRTIPAKWRFGRLFAGRLLGVYRGPPMPDDPEDFPDPTHPGAEHWHGHPPGEWHRTWELPGLQRRIVGFEAADDGERTHLTLHNIRRAPADGGTPVILMHGTGVRANLFYGAAGKPSFVHALVDEGYDVWVENWRASIDFPPRDYTLDDAAEHDHPAAIDAVLELTGTDRLKVLCHCQGSTSFVITALTRPEVMRKVESVVSSAVSLHPVTPTWARRKITLLVPVLARVSPYLSAQWGARAPSAFAWATGRVARLLRRQCDNPVCALGNFMYGSGPDVLWRHANLDREMHEWTAREFGYAPMTFFKQMRRSVLAGHLVPADGRPATTYVDAPLADHMPPWTFVAGTSNRLFTAESQQRTFRHFDARQPGRHVLEQLDGYGHLDVFYARDARNRGFPVLLRGLARS